MIIIYVLTIRIFHNTTATAEMSRIVHVQQILMQLTLFSQLTGMESLRISFGLLAEKTFNQWGFSRISSSANAARGVSVFLEDVLTRKQLRELRHRLQRRIRRFQQRLAKHQSVINAAVLLYGEEQFYLPHTIDKIDDIQTQNPLKGIIDKYLTIIHYKQIVDEVSYKGQVIARRVDDGRDNYIDDDYDFGGVDISIGTLSLCPDITASEEILTAVATLLRYINGGDAYTVGEVETYQRKNPLIDIAWKKYYYWAQFECKPRCLCDNCRSRTARCQECLDDGCEACYDWDD